MDNNHAVVSVPVPNIGKDLITDHHTKHVSSSTSSKFITQKKENQKHHPTVLLPVVEWQQTKQYELKMRRRNLQEQKTQSQQSKQNQIQQKSQPEPKPNPKQIPTQKQQQNQNQKQQQQQLSSSNNVTITTTAIKDGPNNTFSKTSNNSVMKTITATNKTNSVQSKTKNINSINPTTNDTTNGDTEACNKENDLYNYTSLNLTAVIHIGPMKTGSSAIQLSLGSVYNELISMDHYEDSGFAMEDGIEAYHMIGCFRPDSVQYTGGPYFEISCHPNALQQVHAVAVERQHNLIITAEYLTDPKTNIKQLKEFLRPWKYHKVIAYYRRYYDWLISFHNQINKQQSDPSKRKTIVEFITHEHHVHFFWDYMYIVKAIERYEPYFSSTTTTTNNNTATNSVNTSYCSNETTYSGTIQIINTYSQPNHDVRPSFYCEGLVNATAACAKIKQILWSEQQQEEDEQIVAVQNEKNKSKPQKQQQQQDDSGSGGNNNNAGATKIHHMDYENPSIPLVYSDLAYHAKVNGLWDEDDTMLSIDDVSLLIQEYHENTLGKKWYDFTNQSKICLPTNVLDWLLNISLHVEELLFPEYYNYNNNNNKISGGGSGKNEIITHFNEIKTTKLCHIDTQLVLQHQQEWYDFFQNGKNLQPKKQQQQQQQQQQLQQQQPPHNRNNKYQ